LRYFFFLSLICNLAFGRNHFSPKGPTAIWDTSTAAGILNGSGNWTNTSELWTYENGGDNSPFCLGCNVSFGRTGSTGNAGVVTITGTQQINSMSFNSVAGGNYTLTGGTILCVNTPSCTYAVNVSATIASVLSGTKTLIKTGPGTLTLSGVNTYSGGTVISSGTLQASLNNAGTGIVTLGDANSGASNISWFSSGGVGAATNNTVVSNLGTGTVTIGTNSAGTYTQPSGTLTLNRATTLTDGTADRTTFTGKISGNVGTITIAAGRVTFGNAGNDFVGNLWVSNGATYQNDSPTALPVTTNVTLNGNGQFRVNNGGIHTINGLNGQSTDGVSIIAGGNATLSLGNGDGNGSFAGVISNGGGTLSLIKAGTGTQTLSGVNTYTGSTTVNGGTLNLGNGVTTGNIIPAANLITNNSILTYNTPSNITHSGIISGTGGFTKDGTGTITFSGVNTTTGNLTISNGGITFNSDMAATAFPNVSLGAGTTLNFALNPATWVGSAKNFSGSGTINLNANVGINNLNFNTDSNSTLTMGPGTDIQNNTGFDPLTNFAGTLNILGSFTNGDNVISCKGITGNGILNHSTNNVTYNINGPGNFTFSGTSTDMRNISFFNVAAGVTQALSGALAGTGGITKQGGGLLQLSGVNTFTGSTTINGGTLQIGGSGSLGSGTYGGAMSIAAGTTLKYSSSAAQTLSGAISGTGSIVKDTNSSTLSVPNNLTTFTGSVTVNAGTFYCNYPSAVGSAVTVASGATLSLGDNGSGLNIWSPPLTFSGPDSGTNAMLLFNSMSSLADKRWSGAITLNTPTTIRTTQYARPIYLTGTISGASRLTITSDGGINYISGNNTYTGGTTITNGTVTCQNANALGTVGSITVNAGAVLNKGGTGCGGARITCNGTCNP
jgi:autotransporter-associated beta strand protein